MDLGLHDRRALVLASTAGLGRATAAELVAEGARVVVHGRDRGRCDRVASDLGAEGAVDGDLSVSGAAAAVVERAIDLLDGLDILVVNTGGGGVGGLLDGDVDADERAYRSMLRPSLDAARAAANTLRQSDQGRLVFLTARSVVEATPELALSSVFRSGVAAAARSLAIELAPEVLVNVIVTGQFDTGALARFEAARAEAEGVSTEQLRADHVTHIPLQRVGRPEELAAVVTFLCGGRASFVTGSTIRVDGGAVRGF